MVVGAREVVIVVVVVVLLLRVVTGGVTIVTGWWWLTRVSRTTHTTRIAGDQGPYRVVYLEYLLSILPGLSPTYINLQAPASPDPGWAIPTISICPIHG